MRQNYKLSPSRAQVNSSTAITHTQPQMNTPNKKPRTKSGDTSMLHFTPLIKYSKPILASEVIIAVRATFTKFERRSFS
jgi:hypothetical protein